MLSDLRYALRPLLITRGFTVVAVLTIAVGIGANGSLVSIFNQLILKPVTLPSPQSLVAISSNHQNLNFNAPAVSWPRYEFIQAHAKSFSSVADSTVNNFTLLAEILAAVGLYSVLAYTVNQRTNEIGIRMALGAQRRQVIGLILNRGLKLVALGLVLGLVAAAGTARLIQSLLFSVEPLDPLIYTGVATSFAMVAALACILTSIRASRVDPLIALRTE